MLAEDIDGVKIALGALSHRVDPETWAFLKLCRNQLDSAGDLARELEAQVVAVRALEMAARETVHGQA